MQSVLCSRATGCPAVSQEVAIKKVLQDKRFKVRTRPARTRVLEPRCTATLGRCEIPLGSRAEHPPLCVPQNRELQIMKMLDHGNVTTLHHYFYTEGEKVRRHADRPSRRMTRRLAQSVSALTPASLCYRRSPTRPT